ncbi:MAG: hypothetical protein AB7W16_12995 [Candidatus Obscuribacterales bacterium]
MQVGDFTSEAPQSQNDALAGDRLALGGGARSPEQNDQSVTSAGFAPASDLLSGLGGDSPNASAGGPNADIEDSAYEAQGDDDHKSGERREQTGTVSEHDSEQSETPERKDVNQAVIDNGMDGADHGNGILEGAAGDQKIKGEKSPGENQEEKRDEHRPDVENVNAGSSPEDVHESQRSMPDSLSFDPHTGEETAMANSLAGRDAAVSRQQGGDRSLSRGSAEQAARQATSDRGQYRVVKASPALTASFDRYIDKVKDTRQA